MPDTCLSEREHSHPIGAPAITYVQPYGLEPRWDTGGSEATLHYVIDAGVMGKAFCVIPTL